MKIYFQAWLSSLALLSLTACGTMPYYSQPSTTKRAPKAPVVDRTARRPPPSYSPSYPPSYPPAQAPIEPMPQEDPLLPREYASADPALSDTYPPTAPVPTYADPANGIEPQPYPTSPEPTYRPPSATRYAEEGYRPPSYPPGAANPSPRRFNTPAPGSLPEPQVAVVPPTAPTIKPPTAPPMPPVASSPPAAPAAPAAPPTGAPAPANAAVAMTTPPAVAPPEPAPQPAPPPARPTPPPAPPADLPPAEISRDGNQAVVALLDSADKYVKSKQLDKAGAALERALRIEPRNAGIWHDLAQIRLHQGQYQQAESLATKSNNLASDNRSLQARNWKLISSSRRAAGNRVGAEEAEAHAVQLAH